MYDETEKSPFHFCYHGENVMQKWYQTLDFSRSELTLFPAKERDVKLAGYLCFVLTITAAIPSMAQSDAVPPQKMMEAYLNGLAKASLDVRIQQRDALSSVEEIDKYQEDLRSFFLEQLGGFPERTPLNAETAGGDTRSQFRYEKVIFESRPHFFVTAALFLPLTAPPYPAVLIPCGHSENGKASELYQRACIFLAMNGIAAFIYDPIDQGERYQLLDSEGKKRFGGTTGHTMTGVGCILLGTNTATFRIWDGMRAIDYLVSRPDIDPAKIGCAGNSGGGTLTSYLMALDPRIVCAAPSCYLTSWERLLATDGPQDSEQDIYAQIARGMDHADYIMMRAPKPTLICCATQDFFDINGTWDSFRQAKRLYTKLGFPERVDLVEAPEKHGYTPLLRQGMVRWMRRWLMGKDDPVIEAEFTVLAEQEIQCTTGGQVMLLEGARSVYDINAEMEAGFAAGREANWKQDKEKALQEVRKMVGVRHLEELPSADVQSLETTDRDAFTVVKLVITPEKGIWLPTLLFEPKSPSGELCLYLNGDGKDADAAPGGPIEKLAQGGCRVLVPDLRGIGETASVMDNKGLADRFGSGWKDFYRAYLLGKSYLGMRAEDILVCARHLRSLGAPDARVRVIAIGEAGPPALHAVALEPELFTSLDVQQSITSWAEVVRAPEAKRQLMNTVHGALRFYDLPDLVHATDQVRISITDPLSLRGAD